MDETQTGGGIEPPQPPEIPVEPPKQENKGPGKLLIAVVILAALAGGAYYYQTNLVEPHLSGPTGAIVLDGADLPYGWWIADRANVSTQAEGLLEGTTTLSKKLEGGGASSTIFSWTWLFNSSETAQAFYDQIRKEAMEGGGQYFELGAELKGCEGIAKPLPIGGNWAFVTCRTGNLVWEVESRSLVGAAHLYAPTFANLMAKKVAAAS